MTELIKVIVRFKHVDFSAKADLVIALGAKVVNVHSAINAVTLSIPKDKLKQLQDDPDVMYAEQTSPEDVHILAFRSNIAFSVSSSSQTIPWGISKVRATEVHANGNKGTGVRVCILDTGIDYNHEDLKNNYRSGWNFVNNTSNPFDDHGHGTHVAGTVAAEDNDVGVIGVAPEANLFIGKVLDKNGSGSYDNIVAGIQWAIDNNAQIISMSFGGGSYSQALNDICNAAEKAGIVLVAAAGNSNGDGSRNTIGYPAKFPSVMAIAATDSNDNRASFSSTGQELCVSAPGVNVLSTSPKGSCSLCDPTGYKTLNGTSMATPHVSGVVALMLKASPALTPDNVREVLKTSSIDLGVPGFDVFYGYGRIDAVNAATPTPLPELALIDILSSISVEVGKTVTLKATCRDKNNNTMICPTLKWYSSNPEIASVSEGVVTGNSEGSVGIRCSNSENTILSNLCSVTVTAAPVPPKLATIIIPSALTIDVGKAATLTPSCKDDSGIYMRCPILAWSSDNPDIASVVEGVVTGNSQGTANITCSKDTITSNSCSVMVIPIPSPKNKYNVVQLGNIGVLIMKNPFSNVDADGACVQTCKILKDIDKQ